MAGTAAFTVADQPLEGVSSEDRSGSLTDLPPRAEHDHVLGKSPSLRLHGRIAEACRVVLQAWCAVGIALRGVAEQAGSFRHEVALGSITGEAHE